MTDQLPPPQVWPTLRATVVRELSGTDYGSRDFAVRDPEGNLWSFGTYRGEPVPGRN